jgi:hypothetical protein
VLAAGSSCCRTFIMLPLLARAWMAVTDERSVANRLLSQAQHGHSQYTHDSTHPTDNGPLQVFVLAGKSNTFCWMG